MLTFEVTFGKSKTTITLSDDSTIGDLRSALEGWTKVPSHAQKLSGPLGVNKTVTAKLTDCGAKTGEKVRAPLRAASNSLHCTSASMTVVLEHTFIRSVTLLCQNKLSIFGTAADASKNSLPLETNASAAAAGGGPAAAGGGLIQTSTEVLSDGMAVEIFGLKSKPELNGLKARVLNQDSSSGRWTVQVVSSGEKCSLKAENLRVLVVSEGMLVEIHSLKSKAELNGSKARVLNQDSSSGRWTVQVVSSREKCKLKAENLRVLVEDSAVSGRTALGGFSKSLADIAEEELKHFVDTFSITRLAELSFDPQLASEIQGPHRFCRGTPEDERESFLGSLEEKVQERKRMTSSFFCDVSLVREGLERIKAGTRSLFDVLPRKSMCPLDVPLLQMVLTSVKAIEFMQDFPHWLSRKGHVLRAMQHNFEFAQRCGLLVFPSLAKFPGGRIAPGTMADEKAAISHTMRSPRAADFMRQLWASGSKLCDPVTVSFLAHSIQQFDLSEFHDAAVCFYALEYAVGIAQRDPVECVLRLSHCVVFFRAH
jgi:hypothetical protein